MQKGFTTHRVYVIHCIAEADIPMVEMTDTKYPTRSTPASPPLKRGRNIKNPHSFYEWGFQESQDTIAPKSLLSDYTA